jgi:NDP-sugar pyrophosphorylase family protein
MILHQVEALAAAGVTDIVLAVNYRPEVMEKHLAEVSQAHICPQHYRELTELRIVRTKIQSQNHILH